MEQDTPRQPSQSDASPFSDMLSNLLSNPEMMAKIRTVAEQFPTGASSDENAKQNPAVSKNEPVADGLASVLSDPQMMAKLPQMIAVLGPMLGSAGDNQSLGHREKNAEACRNDLLLALKPFLSPERCHAIDTMIRISKLGSVIRQIK